MAKGRQVVSLVPPTSEEVPEEAGGDKELPRHLGEEEVTDSGVAVRGLRDRDQSAVDL